MIFCHFLRLLAMTISFGRTESNELMELTKTVMGSSSSCLGRIAKTSSGSGDAISSSSSIRPTIFSVSSDLFFFCLSISSTGWSANFSVSSTFFSLPPSFSSKWSAAASALLTLKIYGLYIYRSCNEIMDENVTYVDVSMSVLSISISVPFSLPSEQPDRFFVEMCLLLFFFFFSFFVFFDLLRFVGRVSHRGSLSTCLSVSSILISSEWSVSALVTLKIDG